MMIVCCCKGSTASFGRDMHVHWLVLPAPNRKCYTGVRSICNSWMFETVLSIPEVERNYVGAALQHIQPTHWDLKVFLRVIKRQLHDMLSVLTRSPVKWPVICIKSSLASRPRTEGSGPRVVSVAKATNAIRLHPYANIFSRVRFCGHSTRPDPSPVTVWQPNPVLARAKSENRMQNKKICVYDVGLRPTHWQVPPLGGARYTRPLNCTSARNASRRCPRPDQTKPTAGWLWKLLSSVEHRC